MQTLFANKAVVGVVGLFVLGAMAYNWVSEDPTVLEDAQPIGADLIELSNKLKQVELSQELFQKPSYQLLSDFSTPIPEENVGRPNPFALIGQN